MNETMSGTRSRMIYIVDDDPDVRESTQFMLEAGGRTTASFSGGTEFLEKVGDLEPGCILLDVRMPDMDGSDVLKALAKRGIDWPAVIMTGHGDLELAVQMITLGAVDYLEKPFDGAALSETLQRAQSLLDNPGADEAVE